jgi:hypothetical protein
MTDLRHWKQCAASPYGAERLNAFPTGAVRGGEDMTALLLVLVVLVPLFAGCVPGGARSDGIPSADAPFTLTALDVGHPIFQVRCLRNGMDAPSQA